MEMSSKICNNCNKDKLFTEYNKSKSGRYGYMNVCRECRKEHRRTLNFTAPETGSKLCQQCNTVKDVNDFYKDKSSSFGLHTYCKMCSVYNTQVWASTYDGFIKKIYTEIQHNLKKKAKQLSFNITIEDIKQLYTKQKGLCALSGLTLTYNALPKEKQEEHIINYCNISVDRIDSTKGYEKDNIQLVCAIVNRMKTDMKDNTFIDFCKKIVEHNHAKNDPSAPSASLDPTTPTHNYGRVS
jgi:hypothetical protein